MKESMDIKNNEKCAKDKNGISGEVDTIWNFKICSLEIRAT